MDDLIERIVVRAGKCGHHFDPNCEGCLAANRWTNEQLDEQRARIAALEADNARLQAADSEWVQLAIRDNARIVELESVVRMLANFDARNSIVHLRDIARATLAKIKETPDA